MGIIVRIFLIVILLGVLSIVYAESPKNEGYLQVSNLHRLYYETHGNPEGIPVVILHGGPGVGCKKDYLQLFDLQKWYVVMFDQRGAMRSTPFAFMEENTPDHSIEDIEKLRQHCNIDKWYVFGHSWGSCLGLLYGEKHADSCLGFILQGVFLGRDEDIRFFKDMGKYSPKAREQFLLHFSMEEQKDIPHACHARLLDPDPAIHLPMAREVLRCMLEDSNPPTNKKMIEKILGDDRRVLSFTRAFVHYIVHDCFLKPDQVLKNISKITYLPCSIVQGTTDIVTDPRQAETLHKAWPGSQLHLVPDAGHSVFEPAIVNALTEIIKELKLSSILHLPVKE